MYRSITAQILLCTFLLCLAGAQSKAADEAKHFLDLGGGLQAWTSPTGFPITPGADGAYWLKSLAIDDIPSSGVLSIEWKPQAGDRANIWIQSEGGDSSQWISFESGSSGYELHRIGLPFPSGRVQIRFQNANYKSSSLAVRSLAFDPSPQVLAGVEGKGRVELSYEPKDGGEGLVAHLAAIPEPGWSFVEWQGTVSSTRAELSLPLSKVETVTARFAQVFQLSASRWLLSHDGQLEVSLNTEGETPRIRIRNGSAPTVLGVEIVVTQAGSFEAQWGAYGSGSDIPLLLQKPVGERESRFQVDDAPLRLRGGLAIAENADLQIAVVEPQVAFRVLAPEGAVALSSTGGLYPAGKTIVASVTEPFRDAFVAWRGAATGDGWQATLTLQQDALLQAIFRDELTPQGDEQIVTTGTALFEEVPGEMPLYRLPSLPPSGWAELDLGGRGPLTLGLRFPAGTATLTCSIWQGNQLIRRLGRSANLADYYATLKESEEGSLRLLVENLGTEEAAPLSIEVFGYFQERVGGMTYHPSIDYVGGQVATQPALLYYPVGSEVTLEPKPAAGVDFLGWAKLPIDSDARAYTIRSDEAFDTAPRFAPDLGSDKISLDTSASAPWTLEAGPTFISPEPLTVTGTQRISFSVEGPGALAISTGTSFSHRTEPLTAYFEMDGAEVEPASQGSEQNSDYVLLIPDGAHSVSVALGLSDTPSRTLFGRVGTEFSPGYYVGPLPGDAMRYTVEPASENHVYPPATRVQVSATLEPGSTFEGWRGDFDGRPSRFTLPIAVHSVASPIIWPISAIGDVQVSFADNVDASSTTGLDENSTTLYFNNTGSPTHVSFQVPAGVEFSFELSSPTVPATISVDGAPVFQGASEMFQFGLPLANVSREVRVVFDFPNGSGVQISLRNIAAKKRFQLFGAFGEHGEHVLADPYKEFYEPGEQVKIRLSKDAPSDFVFFDLVRYLPNLAEHEWMRDEFVHEFTIEIASDTVVGGTVGPKSARTPGHLRTSTGIIRGAPSVATPTGETATEFTIDSYNTEYIRIYLDGAHHVVFWAFAPEGHYISFDGIEVAGGPVGFAGDGLWHQFSLPAPDGAEYFTLSYFAHQNAAEPFYIGSVHAMLGYGVPFVTTGDGWIAQSPIKGTASAGQSLVLSANAVAGNQFLSWGATVDSSEPSREFTTGDALLLLPAFSSSSDTLSFAGDHYRIVGGAPTVGRFTLASPSREALIFRSDSDATPGLLREVTGPATFRVEGYDNGSGTVSVKLNGELVGTIKEPLMGSVSAVTGQIPAGRHNLTLEYTQIGRNQQGEVFVFKVEIEPGAIATLAPLSSPVLIEPKKERYQVGDVVTLTAQVDDGLAFWSWTGDVSGPPTTMTHVVRDHFAYGVALQYDTTLSGNLPWRATGGYRAPGDMSASLTLTGPGLLTFQGLKPNLTLNGKLPRFERTTSGFHVLIPKGSHQAVVRAPWVGDDLARSTTYVPGYAVLLPGNADRLRLEPLRSSYQRGELVRLSWQEDYISPPEVSLRINGVNRERQIPLEYVVEDHLVLNVEHSWPIPGTGFNANAVKQDAHAIYSDLRFGEEPGFRLQPDPNGVARFLERAFVGPGILSFELAQLDPTCRMQLAADSESAIPLTTGRRYTIRLPAKTTVIKWLIENQATHSSLLPAIVRGVAFAPTEPTEFDRWLSHRCAASSYIASDRIGPDDDLDGDGFTNSQEKAAMTDPGVFDMHSKIISSSDDLGRPHLTFLLPTSFDTERVTLSIRPLAADGSATAWRWQSLDEFPFQVSPHGETHLKITVPLYSLMQDGCWIRIELDPGDP